MKPRLIVFDFDGTIADTLEAARRILNEMSAMYGFKSVDPDEIDVLRHCNLSELISHLGISKIQLPRLLMQGTKKLKSRIDSLDLIEGVKEAVVALSDRGYELGVLTSNSKENVELFLKKHGLEGKFSFISSTSKLTGKNKHMRSICKTFSIDVGSMLYVGDELRDIKAAKKANVPIVAVSWGFNAREVLTTLSPEYLVDEPGELLTIIE